MKSKSETLLFGKNGEVFIPLIRNVLSEIHPYEYEFMDINEFELLGKTQPSKAQKVYWREILMRAHFTAIISLLRSIRWLDGAINAYESTNYLSFTSAIRGFLESAADSFYSLSNVNLTLAENFANIESALLEKVSTKEFFSSKELEDILIHFSHARFIKKGENFPDSHNAKRMSDYIKKMENQNSDVTIGDCYYELCESTHPASQSVYCFTEVKNEVSQKYAISQTSDKEFIESFCKRYEKVFNSLFQYQFNAALFALRVINSFSIDEYKTPIVDQISFDNIKGWEKLKQLLPREF